MTNYISKLFSLTTLKLVIIFLAGLALMIHIQFNPLNRYFSGYDDYYHAKMAEIIKEKGIIHQFPWMQYTILKDNFVDHHFLFHVFLIPFVTLGGIVNGSKIFIVLIMALVFLLFYVLLRENHVPGAFWLSLFAIFTMPLDFYFRMNFIRAMGLSLLFMCLGLYFIFKKKPIALSILAFLYVWTYSTFIIIPFMALVYVIIQFLKGEKINLKLAIFPLLAMVAGLIINPYFPNNFAFLKAQMFATGFGAKEYTGGEWRPYDTWFWLTTNSIPLIILAAGLFLSLLKNYKQSVKSITIFVVMLLFIALQWKSKRFVEYAPFFISLSGIILLKGFLKEKIGEWKKKVFFKQKENFIYGTTVVAFLIVSFFYSQAQISGAVQDSRPDFSMSALEKVQNYLKENSQEGDIVFTDDWDVFPKYFFLNHKDYYLVGLDPEFMNQYAGWPYEGEKGKLYKEFADISSGQDASNLERIKNDFKAKWIIVGTDHQQFRQNLKEYPELFKEVMSAKNDYSPNEDLIMMNDGYYLFKVL